MKYTVVIGFNYIWFESIDTIVCCRLLTNGQQSGLDAIIYL